MSSAVTTQVVLLQLGLTTCTTPPRLRFLCPLRRQKNSAEGGDYDFASGGWTQLGATQTVTSGGQIDALDLSSIASAQYIGLEIMSSLKADNRVGFEEVAITAVPEPSSFALLAGCFGLAWIMVRRRA